MLLNINLKDVELGDSGEVARDTINENFDLLAGEVGRISGFHWAMTIYSKTYIVPLFPGMKKIVWAGGFGLNKLYVKSVKDTDTNWREVSPGDANFDISTYVPNLGMMIKPDYTNLDNCATINLIMT
ncbi:MULTISPECIES: hypothetical protein [unclassified Dysgonomonas]|uniref:hypothetical protein n=1 Tax=unclassified Dysgonomonas TaxID=2630389 RepID=UPI0013EA383E|nr:MULTISPECIES: hypothetical protein [unclassified Dysgonomonas]